MLRSSFLLDLYVTIYYKYNNSRALPVMNSPPDRTPEPLQLEGLFAIGRACMDGGMTVLPPTFQQGPRCP